MVKKHYSKLRRLLCAFASLAIVICSLPVSLSVFAESDISDKYTVSHLSPAIPMVKSTMVNFSDFNIEVNGAVLPATRFSWENTNSDVVIRGNYIIAKNTGVYPVTAVYGDTRIPLFVVVREANDTEWVLYNETFGEYSSSSQFPENWSAQIYSDVSWHPETYRYNYVDVESPWDYNVARLISATGPGIVPFENIGNSIYAAQGLFTLNDSVVNSFGDYTISADLQIYSHFSDINSGAGLFGRAAVDNNGKLQKDLSTYTAIVANNKSDKKTVCAVSITANTNSKTTTQLFDNNQNSQWEYMGGVNINSGIGTVKNYSVKYSGNTATMFSNEDSEKKTFTTTVAESSGAVGVYAGLPFDNNMASSVNVKSFKVTLNNAPDECPVYEEYEEYIVTSGSPAIPMNEMTSVLLANLSVELDGGVIPATEFVWENDNESIIIDSNKIIALKKGIYTVTATHNEKTVNIYIIVKAKDDTEWVLYEKNFESNTFPSDWVAQWRTKDGEWLDIAEPTAYTGTRNGPTAAAPGVVPFGNVYEITTTNYWVSQGYFTLKNDIVSSFADYTVTADVQGYTHNGNDIGMSGFGIFGRADTDTNGKLTESTNASGMYVNTNKKLVRQLETTNRTYPEITSNDGTQVSFRNLIGRTAVTTLTAKFSNNSITLNNEMNVPFNTETANTQNGTVGIYCGMIGDTGAACWVNVRNVKIALNNSAENCPKYKDFNQYIVNQENPVIPINTFTTVLLSGIVINANGEVKEATEFSFENNNESLLIDNERITALKPGVYSITATSDNLTMTLYVAAKGKEDAQWVIYDKEFTDNVIPDDWTAQWRTSAGVWNDITEATAYTGTTNGPTTESPGVVPFGNVRAVDTQNFWFSTGYFTLNNDAVKSLSDYTVTADMVGYTHNGNNYYISGFGIFGRANTDETGKLNGQSNFKGLFVNSFTPLVRQLDLANKNPEVTNVDGLPLTFANLAAKRATTTLTEKFDGSKITLNNEQEVPFEITDNNIRQGTVGIYCGMIGDQGPICWVNVRRVRITLNNEQQDCPSYTDNDCYIVSDNSPAIPMNKLTYVDLTNLIFEFKDNGQTKYAFADKCEFTPVGNITGVTVDKTNSVLNAYEDGIYEYDVTYKNLTKKVFVFVKEPSNTEWVIHNESFTNYRTLTEQPNLPENWQLQYWRTSDKTWNSLHKAMINDEHSIPDADGILPFYYKMFSKDDSMWETHGFFYLDNHILNYFADYTVLTDMYAYGHNGGGSGIVARINKNGADSINTDSSFIGFINNNSTGWGSYTYSRPRYIEYSQNNIKQTDINPLDAKGTNKWDYGFNNKIAHQYSVKLEGGKGTFWSDLDETESKFTTDIGGGKGSVGVSTFDLYDGAGQTSFLKLNNIKVKLNNTDEDIPRAYPITVSYDDVKVKVNTRFDLRSINLTFGETEISGMDIMWQDAVTSVGEVSDNMFMAYSVGTMSVTARYNGQTQIINITVVSDGANVPHGEIFAPDFVSVIPDTETNAANYKVVINYGNNKKLRDYTVTVTDNGNDMSYSSSNNADTEFPVQIIKPSTVIISTHFDSSEDVYLKSLGATVSVSENGSKSIKFSNRTSSIVRNRENDNVCTSETVKIGDTTYIVKEVGTIIIPNEIIPEGEELTVNTNSVQKHVATSTAKATYNYADIEVILTNIPSEYSDVLYASRGYILVTDSNDKNPQYIYSDVITRSYNQVLEAAYPKINSVIASNDDYVNLMVDNDVDGIDNTNRFTYSPAENISFMGEIKGAYKLNCKLMNNGQEVASGTFIGGKFKLSTQIADMGIAWLQCSIVDFENKVVKEIRISAGVNVTEYVNQLTSTIEDVNSSSYRLETDNRINEIKNTSTTILPSESGTAYYVSPDGLSTNDGKSELTPVKTLNDVSKLDLKAGDVVYFKRGGVWRGNITTKADGVTYSAYGTGEKPQLWGSPYSGVSDGTWTNIGNNIYEYSMNFYNDVGVIVFNDTSFAYKMFMNGETAPELTENLQFYHNWSTKKVYLRSDNGNPAEIFDSIEFCQRTHGFNIRNDNITVDNFNIKYVGAHGIGAGSRNGLKVTNCMFKWMGGSLQFTDGSTTRYGNGVEIYGGCDGFVIDNCYFDQIYDAAVTFQFITDVNNQAGYDQRNIDFTNNVIERSNYSVEYFLTGKESVIENVNISNNYMWYAGVGVSETRADKHLACCHVKGWTHDNIRKGYFNITDNVFALSEAYLFQSGTKFKDNGPMYSGNTYIQYTDKKLGYNDISRDWIYFDSNVIESIIDKFGDINPNIVFVNR